MFRYFRFCLPVRQSSVLACSLYCHTHKIHAACLPVVRSPQPAKHPSGDRTTRTPLSSSYSLRRPPVSVMWVHIKGMYCFCWHKQVCACGDNCAASAADRDLYHLLTFRIASIAWSRPWVPSASMSLTMPLSDKTSTWQVKRRRTTK